MATRSTIALEFSDNTVGQVYCHHDGYLSNNGMLLLKHYTDPAIVAELIKNGYISSLGEEIGIKHPFDLADYSFMTKFYGRDRDDENVDANYFKNFDDYVKNHQYEEYEYILRTDGKWYVNQGNGYELLTQSLIDGE